MLLDVIFAAGVGIGIVALWDRRRRIRGSVWRFSLREALAALTLAAIVAGCWKTSCDANQRLEAQVRQVYGYPFQSLELVADLPEWLRPTVGDENLRWYPIRELAFMDGYRQQDDRSVNALRRLPHLKEVRIDSFRRLREAEKAFNRFKDALPQLASPFDFDGPIPVVG